MLQRIVLGGVLVVFTAATIAVLAEYGYVGFYEAALANNATRLTFLDLAISLGLISVWMIQDAWSSHRSLVPFLLLTVLFGGVGPLLYLLVRASPVGVQRTTGGVALAVLSGVALTLTVAR